MNAALSFDEQAELEALEHLELVIQYFSAEKKGLTAQIFSSFMTPKQHRRLAQLREMLAKADVPAEAHASAA